LSLRSGNDASLYFYLNNFTDVASLSKAVLVTPYCGGNTNTTGGLRLMRQQIFSADHGDRPDVPNLCIMITDGIPTREVEGLWTEVGYDKAAGIRIIGIGVTSAVSLFQKY